MPRSTDPTPRRLLAYRVGRVLQVLGMIISLEALLLFGSAKSEGPMLYTAVVAVAVFYLGTWLVRRRPRFGPGPKR